MEQIMTLPENIEGSRTKSLWNSEEEQKSPANINCSSQCVGENVILHHIYRVVERHDVEKDTSSCKPIQNKQRNPPLHILRLVKIGDIHEDQ